MTRLRVVLLVLYVLLIFFFSTRPYLQSPGPDFSWKDKVAHTAEYLILGILLYVAAGASIRRPPFTLFWVLFAVGATLAAVDEVLQAFIPGRLTDIYDWMADTVGVALGVLTAMIIVGNARAHDPRPDGKTE